MSSLEERLFSIYLDKAQAETAALAKEVRNCHRCTLRQERFKPVSGAGFPLADILLLKGMASLEELRSEIAFYGKVANAMFKAVSKLGLDVTQLYGTNAIKCSPAKNREISSDEIGTCSEHLKTEIAILEPRIIVAFGSLATEALQAVSNGSFSERRFKRGEVVSLQSDLAVIFTHDIDRALEISKLKEELWQDLKLLLKVFTESVSNQSMNKSTKGLPSTPSFSPPQDFEKPPSLT